MTPLEGSYQKIGKTKSKGYTNLEIDGYRSGVWGLRPHAGTVPLHPTLFVASFLQIGINAAHSVAQILG
jgi:hypothetical protein